MLDANSLSTRFKKLRLPVAGLALIFLLDGPPRQVRAQSTNNNNSVETRAFAPGAIDNAQKMRIFNETAQAIVAAQFNWQAKLRDLDVRYQHEANQLRDAFLAEVREINGGRQ